jgi:hypothetical protein
MASNGMVSAPQKRRLRKDPDIGVQLAVASSRFARQVEGCMPLKKNLSLRSRPSDSLARFVQEPCKKRSCDELGRFGGLVLAPKAGSDPRALEPDLTRHGINQKIGRLHILVNQLPFVQPAEWPLRKLTLSFKQLALSALQIHFFGRSFSGRAESP